MSVLEEIDHAAALGRAQLTLAACADDGEPRAAALARALDCIIELANLARAAERRRLEAEERLRAMRIRAGGLS